MRKLALLLALCLPLLADDVTRLQIKVTTQSGRPVDRATVIVKFVSGHPILALGLKKTITSWELKTSQEGLAKIPSIPKGKIQIQVTSKNYQSFGETFDIQEDERLVEVKLNPPQKQYSAHEK